MTPHELNLYIQAYNEKEQEKGEEDLIVAYLTAYWGRVRRMPNLKELINKTKPKKPLSDEQLLAQVKALNAVMGGQTKVREQE